MIEGQAADLGQGSNLGFDELVAELEKSIAQLADGSAPLDDLVAAHARAVRLLAEARSRLAGIEARVAEPVTLGDRRT